MSKLKSIFGLVLPALVVGFLLARCGSIFPEHSVHQHGEAGAENANVVWTCSMHPQFQFPEQTPCPICGMDLIPIDPSSAGLGERQVGMSTEAEALAEIQTTPVKLQEVSRELRLVGKFAWDETRLSSLTAWTGGRIDKLQLNKTGEEVVAGQVVAELWSPELNKNVATAPSDSLRRTAAASLSAARERLIQLGMTAKDIDGLLAGNATSEHIELAATNSGVVIERMAAEGDWVKKGQTLYRLADTDTLWVLLEAHESDLAWLSVGQSVSLQTEAYPGRSFMGELSFIAPVLDQHSRTVEVRVSVKNPSALLRPGMFARAIVNAPLQDSVGKKLLTIPTSSPLITGKRAVAYVKLPDQERPTFEGREIVLGARVGDNYVVLEGINEGELVVTNGAFKIDSALQIQAKPSMMTADNSNSKKQLKVPSDFRVQMGNSATPYLDLRIALAADDYELAMQHASAFTAAIKSINHELLDESARDRWEPLFARMSNGAVHMNASKEIEDLRVGFDRASKGIIQALDLFGYQRPGDDIKVFFCPMAFNDTGAEWLQIEKRLANPYFGASMLRCGELRRKIPVSVEVE